MTIVTPLNLPEPIVLLKAPRKILLEKALPICRVQQKKPRLSLVNVLRERLMGAKADKEHVLANTSVSFDVAVWMRFTENHRETISLLLCYKDASGEYSLTVDSALAGSSRDIMLSGMVEFEIKGKLEHINVCCAGIASDEPHLVDDTRLSRIMDKAHENDTTIWKYA